MNRIIAAALFLFVAAVSSPAQVTLQSGGDSRALFETLAERGGVNMVFAPGFQSRNIAAVNIANRTVAEALDILSKDAGAFWSSWDARTIIVATDNPTNRRAYERLSVAAIPGGTDAFVTQLRTTYAMQNLVNAGSAIVMKDTPARIAVAERAATAAGLRTETIDSELFLTADGPRFRSTAATRSQLRPSSRNPVALDLKDTSAAAYETLARLSGLTIIIDTQLRPSTTSFKVSGVDPFDALDLLALQTGTFWQPFDEKTLLVFEDTVVNRRSYESRTVETLYLPAGTSPTRGLNLVNSLRILGARNIFHHEGAAAVVVNDTPRHLEMVELLLARLTGSPTPLRKEVATELGTGPSESGFYAHTSAYERARLQIKTAGPLSLNVSEPRKGVFEKLAAIAGLRVVFDSQYRDVTVAFKVDNADVVKALDLLSIQTGSLWQRLDSQTILVMEDNQQNRRDSVSQIVKTFNLPAATSTMDQASSTNILRTTLGLRGVFQLSTMSALAVRDTSRNLEVAEKVLGHVTTAGPVRTVEITPDLAEVFLTENGISFRTSPSTRALVKIRSAAPLSLQTNEPVTATYERLAGMAGVRVVLDSGVRQRPVSFKVDNENFFAALDLLALQTGTFWQAFNESTFIVFEDNQQNRRDYDAQILKTIYLPPGTPTPRLQELVNTARLLFGLRAAFSSESANAIVIRDTAANMLLAERLIAELGGGTPLRIAAGNPADYFGENGTHFRAADYERSRLRPASAGRLSMMAASEPAKGVFERLAASTGLKAVFAPSFRGVNVSFDVNDFDPMDALDLLALQTRSLWVPLDSETILIAEDNAQNRRTFDAQVVKAIHLPRTTPAREMNEILNTLRAALGFRYLLASETAATFIMRDTPRRMALAEKVIESLRTTQGAVSATLIAPQVFLTESGPQLRSPDALRSQLKTTAPGPITLTVNNSSLAIYETLAALGGLRVVAGPDVRPRTTSFRVEDVTFFDALDRLALETATFWVPFNETTIVIFDDNMQNRRDFEPQTAETVYLPAGTSSQFANEIVNLLRTSLSLRGVFQNDEAKAIVIRDTASNIDLMEAVVADLIGAGPRKAVASDPREPMSENGFYRSSQYQRGRLQVGGAPAISLTASAPSKALFEQIGAAAGLNVIFGRTYRGSTVSFSVDNAGLFDALDQLALQSRSAWNSLDARTILVMDDSQQNRRDYGAQIVKTVYLPASSTPTEIYGILNVLRTALTLRGVYQHETARAIVIRDVPSRVALAERVIGHLNTSSTPIASVLLPSQGITENGSLGIASSARKQLQPAASGTASLNLNADARTAFETVGKIAGVAVTFHPRFTAGSASPLRVDGVDAVDLLDYVALVTGNIWKVVDSRTILVAPDSWETRRELESITTKVFTLQTNTPGHASGIGNVLRIVGGFRQVEQIGSDAVAVWDAPERIALAEQIVAALEKQP